MKLWQFLVAGLATLAVTSSLKVGPVRLANNNRFINYTKGASPNNSLLECLHQLDEDEQVTMVSWVLRQAGEIVGTFDWHAGDMSTATYKLAGMVSMNREDGSLELVDLSYDLSGVYSCSLTLTDGKTQEAAGWEVLVVESASHLSTLHRSLSGCVYTSSYSTLAMYPEPDVRAGLYSETTGSFYKEIPKTQWLVHTHENGSFTYSYSNISFEFEAQTPMDISFYVMVGVMKTDSNYIPISSAMDKHIILHQLGCPEPRLEAYQHIEYHRDTITCRGEHKEAEATVTCKEGFHSDGEEEEVLITCDEPTLTWVLEDGTPAKREHLQCVMNGALRTTSISATLLCLALLLQRLLLL